MAHRCGVRSVAGFAYRLSPSRLPRRCQQQREARDPRNSVDNVAVLSHPLDETPRRRVPGFYRFPLFGRAHRAAAAVAHGARLVLWQPWRTLSATCLDSARRLCLAGCAFGHARTRAVLSCAECAMPSPSVCYWEPDDWHHDEDRQGPHWPSADSGTTRSLGVPVGASGGCGPGIRWLVDAIAIHDYGRRFCFLLGGCLCLVRRAVLAPTVAAAVDGKPG